MQQYYQTPYRLQLSLPDGLRARLQAVVKQKHTTQQQLLVEWIEAKVQDEEQATAGPAPAPKGG